MQRRNQAGPCVAGSGANLFDALLSNQDAARQPKRAALSPPAIGLGGFEEGSDFTRKLLAVLQAIGNHAER